MKCDMKEKEKISKFCSKRCEDGRKKGGIILESSSEECIPIFPKEHIKGISEAAAELDVNVCFFLGTRTKDFFRRCPGQQTEKFPMTINLIPYMTTA